VGRGLPFSVMLHAVVLTAVLLFGGHVSRPPLPRERIMRVRLAQLPVQKQLTAPQQVVVEPESEPVSEPPPVIEEAPPEMPPKELPQQPREEPQPQENPPQPPPRDPDPEPRESPAETPVAAAASGPAVSTTDVDFPFAYYLNLIEGRITRQWQPKQLGFRAGANRACVVHFVIARSGHVSRVSIVQTSGVALFDREALRAVQAAAPLAPLPAKFAGRDLPVSMIFTLEPGT